MSENEANSFAAELSRDEDRPPLRLLKNDLLVAVHVFRAAELALKPELPVPGSESESMLRFNSSSSTYLKLKEYF